MLWLLLIAVNYKLYFVYEWVMFSTIVHKTVAGLPICGMQIGKNLRPFTVLEGNFAKETILQWVYSKGIAGEWLFTSLEFDKEWGRDRNKWCFLHSSSWETRPYAPHSERRVESEQWGQIWSVDMSLSALIFFWSDYFYVHFNKICSLIWCLLKHNLLNMILAFFRMQVPH